MTTATAPFCGEAVEIAFPSYPQFQAAQIPDQVFLRKIVDGNFVFSRVHPVRAWQGVVQPFADDQAAREALRLLDSDRSIDVLAGNLIGTPEAKSMMPHPAEPRLTHCSESFDVLVLEFEAPAHPWVFSLSPAISTATFPDHPHLRSDRILQLPSRTLHGLCIYSAAEFTFDANQALIPQFLNQTSIYLGKHLIWRIIRRLFDTRTGEVVDDGTSAGAHANRVPVDSVWQVRPTRKWLGFWPGKTAASGKAHLLLDPHGQCWCGEGTKYKECCRPEEARMWGVVRP